MSCISPRNLFIMTLHTGWSDNFQNHAAIFMKLHFQKMFLKKLNSQCNFKLWSVSYILKLTSDGIPPHYGLLCIPSSFLEQEEVEISAYLVQLDYYVPMLFMHWNNLSRAGHCTVIHKSNIPFGNLTISGQNSLQHLLLFFNNEAQSWSLSIT